MVKQASPATQTRTGMSMSLNPFFHLATKPTWLFESGAPIAYSYISFGRFSESPFTDHHS
jgi:hypothetical protein